MRYLRSTSVVVPRKPADDAASVLLPATLVPRELLAAIDARVKKDRAHRMLTSRAMVVRELLARALGKPPPDAPWLAKHASKMTVHHARRTRKKKP